MVETVLTKDEKMYLEYGIDSIIEQLDAKNHLPILRSELLDKAIVGFINSSNNCEIFYNILFKGRHIVRKKRKKTQKNDLLNKENLIDVKDNNTPKIQTFKARSKYQHLIPKLKTQVNLDDGLYCSTNCAGVKNHERSEFWVIATKHAYDMTGLFN